MLLCTGQGTLVLEAGCVGAVRAQGLLVCFCLIVRRVSHVGVWGGCLDRDAAFAHFHGFCLLSYLYVTDYLLASFLLSNARSFESCRDPHFMYRAFRRSI
jgi:hypothetical protein